MNLDLRKMANVLDAAANYVEAVEREKTSSIESARQAAADKVAAAHATALGEEIPSDVRKKLAGADPAVLSYVQEVLAKSAGAVDALGTPAATEDDQPVTTKEATDAADKRFLSWLVS
jgi:hypothetical protein